jgi:hypothetical protein
MNLILAIAVGLVVCWLLAHIVTTAIVITRASRPKVEELKHLQGSILNVTSGRLRRAPARCDFRVVQGLEWDGKKYVAQSRLSTEAIRSAFFQ